MQWINTLLDSAEKKGGGALIELLCGIIQQHQALLKNYTNHRNNIKLVIENWLYNWAVGVSEELCGEIAWVNQLNC